MPTRQNLVPDAKGYVQAVVDLAEYVGTASFDEVVIEAPSYDYVTVHLVAENTLTWGSGSIKVRRSNDGINAVEFQAGAVSLTAVGMSNEQTMRATRFLHIQVGSSATPTTASGRVRLHVQFHRV